MRVDEHAALLHDYLAIKEGKRPPSRSRAARGYRKALRKEKDGGEAASSFLERKIRWHEDSIESLRFVRELLAREANWVKRYLKDRDREPEAEVDPSEE
jgi:hypothetical protein